MQIVLGIVPNAFSLFVTYLITYYLPAHTVCTLHTFLFLLSFFIFFWHTCKYLCAYIDYSLFPNIINEVQMRMITWDSKQDSLWILTNEHRQTTKSFKLYVLRNKVITVNHLSFDTGMWSQIQCFRKWMNPCLIFSPSVCPPQLRPRSASGTITVSPEPWGQPHPVWPSRMSQQLWVSPHLVALF